MIIRENHAAFLLAAVVLVVIWAGNFVFFLNGAQFYENEFEKLGVNKTMGFNAINYLNQKEELSSEFNERESEHFSDVRSLFSKMKILYYASLVLMAALAIYLYLKMPQAVPKAFAVSGAASLCLLVLVFVALLNFEWFFLMIHKPFFEPGTYIFPLEFFQDASGYLARRVFVNSALFLGLGLLARRYFRNYPKTSEPD